jgi:5,10-methylenetetrahydromethanopterin reductase
MPASPPLAIVSEAVSSLRALLAGEVLDQDGVLHESAGLRLTGEVSGAVPPIFVAAVGPKALQQAGSTMDGVILTMMCSRAHASWAAGVVKDAAAAAGRPAIPVVAYLPIAVDPDGERAKQRMRGVLADFIARWSKVSFLSKLFTEWSELDDDRMQQIAVAVADGDDLRYLVPDDLVDQFCIAGSPEECRDLVEEFGAAGITEIALDPGRDIAGALDFVRSVTGK